MTYIVTGASAGIGKSTAAQLARTGAPVLLLCRSEARAQRAVDDIKRATGNDGVEFLLLDLGDYASIRACADRILQRHQRIDALINNGGTGSTRGGVTKDGFELCFGTNHLGHFLLTHLLLDRLVASAPSRIVTVTSKAHEWVKSIDWEAVVRPTQSETGFKEYQVSKLANLLFTRALAERLQGTQVTTYAVHPGLVATNALNKIPWWVRLLLAPVTISEERGARPSVRCATDPALAGVSGCYYAGLKEKAPARHAQERSLADELWSRSAGWVGL